MDTVSLNQLIPHKQYQIQSVEANPEFGELDELVSRRLADLGFCRGAVVEIIGKGVFGVGPYAVRLGNQSQFSLRKAEAQKIMCLPFSNESAR